ALPGPPAILHRYGTPPPPVCFTIASSCLSSEERPEARFETLPACHFVAKFWTAFVYETPAAVIGEVLEYGLPKIFRNVAKCASGVSSFDVSEAVVDGTLRSPFDSFASACVFIVRYLTRFHASAWCLPFFGMPMIVPLM